MPVVKALKLEDHLRKAEPAPVYALVGQDDALRSRSLRLLEAFAAPPEQPGSSVRRFEGVPEARDVFGELRTVPFLGMAGRRVAVVEQGDAFLKAHGAPAAGGQGNPLGRDGRGLWSAELVGCARFRRGPGSPGGQEDEFRRCVGHG